MTWRAGWALAAGFAAASALGCGDEGATGADAVDGADTAVDSDTQVADSTSASDAVGTTGTMADEVTPDSVADSQGDADGEVTDLPDLPDLPDQAAWTQLPPLPSGCAPTAADAPLLADVLAAIGLTPTTLGWTEADLARSTKYYAGGFLDDPFLLPWFRPTMWAPLEATCYADGVATAFDGLVAGSHPVSDALRHAARLIDLWPSGPASDAAPTPSAPTPPGDLAAAIGACCEAANERCTPDVSAIPAGLQATLVPIFDAMADGIRARRAMKAAAPSLASGNWVNDGGLGTTVLAPYDELTKPAVMAFLADPAPRRALALAAARIAFAVESADFGPWASASGIVADIATPLGWIRIRDAADDVFPADLGELFFLLDLGGKDTHEDGVAATTPFSPGVNIAIDLAGDDHYGYAAVASPADRPGLVPADAAGRFAGNEFYGPFSLSKVGRQGAGRFGIGLLFDLGAGNDTYASLTMSQGYAHVGVGVLYDDGGSDRYDSEEASQGNAAYGIGLLLDRGAGNDTYAVMNHGAGAGGPGGVGVLFDGGGDDTYTSDPGTPESGGNALYYSPQMPNAANHSGSQGAGLGVRWDEKGLFLSGGLGILRDQSGDDRYLCGLFCQGSAFWQATGILSDGAGADHYDALWYVQGGAAHYAMGFLLDGGPGGDVFNANQTPVNVTLGAGHDFSLGVLVNVAGDDSYRSPSLSAGAGNCDGIGLFVDRAGTDTYLALSESAMGYANLGECLVDPDRPLVATVGLMIDAGGVDLYSFPAVDRPLPRDDGAWGVGANGVATELGVGKDATGEPGLTCH